MTGELGEEVVGGGGFVGHGKLKVESGFRIRVLVFGEFHFQNLIM